MDPNFSHIFLPRQTIATDEEVQDALEKYKITKENLPIIKADDPAAKTLQAKAGDVIKVIRTFQTGGKEELYYRLVID